MIKVIFWLAVISTLLGIMIPFMDRRIDRMQPTRKIRRWWKNHIVGDDLYGDSI